MIISPPFLPSRPGHEMDSADAGDTLVPDHDVCAAGMQECAPGNGAYPVSYSLGWHGGPHLIAPSASNGQGETVRAIADGKVVYMRQTSTEKTAPLQYRNVRTDDGCVVIKHTTEIGEGESAKVTFFSIYMHLQSVVGAVVVGKAVYRKDKLGIAGQINGQPGQMHFEIVCDEANLQKLVGRSTGPLVKPQGRKDAIYGDIWFKVPKGAKLFDKEPHPYRRDDSEPPLGTHPSVQRQQAIGVTGSDLVIRMHFERGDCALTTFTLKQDGSCTQVGDPSSVHEYEYNMYSEAMRLNKRYSDGSTAPAAPSPKAPSPSLIYEMLRFGRPVSETMPPDVKFGHWRKVVTPEGTGWLNLNQPTIGVYSDADFPQWAGWSLIDDDTDVTSLCTSPTMKRWLDLDGDGHVTHAEAKEALHNKTVAKRMSMAICKFPIEWSKEEATINARWGWVKASEALPSPLSSANFDLLKAHIQALAFWEDIQDSELPEVNACWHFPPKAFVEQFRKCGWISSDELARIIPNASSQNIGRFLKPINLISNKYFAGNKVRLSHFLGQVGHETGDLAGAMVEAGNNPLSKAYEVTQDYYRGPDSYHYFAKHDGYERLHNTLGNAYGSGDGIKFRGRGALQVTGRDAYSRYWVFRGWISESGFDRSWWNKTGWWSIPPNPMIRPAEITDPQKISARSDGNELNPIDVSGWYWITCNINYACDKEAPTSKLANSSESVSTIINKYDRPTFDRRKKRTEKAKEILCDSTS